MSADRELLELAAKAAGYAYTNLDVDTVFWVSDDGDFWTPWNPVTDDGDALRLAVKLGLQIRHYPIYDTPRFAAYVREAAWDSDAQRSIGVEMLVNYEGDPCAATRRAIVRAAAEIGRTM